MNIDDVTKMLLIIELVVVLIGIILYVRYKFKQSKKSKEEIK